MVTINVRYLRERLNRNGKRRFYWIRPGFKVVKLPSDLNEAVRVAMQLNEDAKRGLRRVVTTTRSEDDPNLFAHWIERYQRSDAFAALAASSKEGYRIACNRLKGILGEAEIDGITALVVRRYLTEHEPSLQLKHRARAVISNIMSEAIDGGMVATNPVRDVKLKTPPSRKAIYTDEDIATNLEAIDREPEERRKWLRMAFMLELFTGQRIGDCLAMTWGAYDGEYIDVVQEKTGREVSVYCHSALKAALEAAKATRTGVHIVQGVNGRPIRYGTFQTHMKRIRDGIGLGHLRNHDLRRTAATKLAEAENSIAVIAAVTGHSEQYIQALCQVYIQKTRRMTKAAITRLEKFEKVNADVNE
jgi:integrase